MRTNWLSEGTDLDEDDLFDEEDYDDEYNEGVEVEFDNDNENVNHQAEQSGNLIDAGNGAANKEESDDEFGEEVNSATFIMNQKV